MKSEQSFQRNKVTTVESPQFGLGCSSRDAVYVSHARGLGCQPQKLFPFKKGKRLQHSSNHMLKTSSNKISKTQDLLCLVSLSCVRKIFNGKQSRPESVLIRNFRKVLKNQRKAGGWKYRVQNYYVTLIKD
jgi:hypothetical protein